MVVDPVGGDPRQQQGVGTFILPISATTTTTTTSYFLSLGYSFALSWKAHVHHLQVLLDLELFLNEQVAVVARCAFNQLWLVH